MRSTSPCRKAILPIILCLYICRTPAVTLALTRDLFYGCLVSACSSTYGAKNLFPTVPEFFTFDVRMGLIWRLETLAISAFWKMNTTIVLRNHELYCTIFRISFSFEFSLVNQIRESHQFQKVTGTPGFFILSITMLKYAVRLCCSFDHATTVCGTNLVNNLKKVIFFYFFQLFVYDDYMSLLRKNCVC